MLIKVLIHDQLHPDLHRALLDVDDVRRRSQRLRDLANKGLLVEQLSGYLRMDGSSGTPAIQVVWASPERESASIEERVALQLDWGDQEAGS